MMTSLINSRAVSDATCIAYWLEALLLIVANNAYANEPPECLIEPHWLVAITSSRIGVLASVGVDESDVVR